MVELSIDNRRILVQFHLAPPKNILGKETYLKICALCGRKISPGAETKHHLVPRSMGGSNGDNVIELHSICHKQIHALFSRHDLSTTYNTIEKLKQTNRIRKFLKWVSDKPIDFDKKFERVKNTDRAAFSGLVRWLQPGGLGFNSLRRLHEVSLWKD